MTEEFKAARIAEYGPGDEDDVRNLLKEVFHDLGHEFNLLTKDEDLSRIPEVYQTDEGRFFLGRIGGELVGTIALRPIDQVTCELKRFYVRKQNRGSGIGKALLDRVIDSVRSGPWTALRLDTTLKSAPAIRLFKRQGFRVIPRYNEDPFAQVFMELRLR